ncbi:expressed unknown protein [Seminavis robusta]|uniref:Magnesium transporter n=1 Tax=Seminavis robusta TaxID=568900 RepID=A0A9N8DNR4_9STRA|nr:expressed unknown protein [Seminavis robusta]|eukprot:Sro157_g071170.1 n/a (436) ;mRNA; r:48084-49391
MDASDWITGVCCSVIASLVGAASTLTIRKSWLMEEVSEQPSSYQALNLEDIHPHEEYIETNFEEGSIHGDNSNGSPLVEIECGDDEGQGRCLGCPQSHTDSPVQGDNTIPLLGEFPPSCCCCAASILGCCHCCTLARILRFTGMLGISLLCPPLVLVAMEYATPSILAPFSGLNLVWVIVFSKSLVGEEPSFAQKVASTLIVTGEVTVAIFGDHNNEGDATRASVEASYREGPFIAYFLSSAVYVALITLWIRSPTTIRSLRRFAWGTSGGAISGMAQCFVKDSLIVVSTFKKGPSISIPWYLPLFILLAIGLSLGGLLLNTATMKRYDATFSQAVSVGSYVVSTSLMSAAHYHTFEHLDSIANLVMYPIGLFILMLGVAILVQGSGSSNPSWAYSEDVDDPNHELLREGADLAIAEVNELFVYGEHPTIETDDQ